MIPVVGVSFLRCLRTASFYKKQRFAFSTKEDSALSRILNQQKPSRSGFARACLLRRRTSLH